MTPQILLANNKLSFAAIVFNLKSDGGSLGLPGDPRKIDFANEVAKYVLPYKWLNKTNHKSKKKRRRAKFFENLEF